MKDPDAPNFGDAEPVVVEIPTTRVDARITMDDIAARLHGRSGPAADLARQLAQELGSET